MRKRPSKRRIWARFVRGDWVYRLDWERYDLWKRLEGGGVIFNVSNFSVKRPAKEIRGE